MRPIKGAKRGGKKASTLVGELLWGRKERVRPQPRLVAPQWMDTVTFCSSLVARLSRHLSALQSLGKTQRQPIPYDSEFQSFLSTGIKPANFRDSFHRRSDSASRWLLFPHLSNAPRPETNPRQFYRTAALVEISIKQSELFSLFC